MNSQPTVPPLFRLTTLCLFLMVLCLIQSGCSTESKAPKVFNLAGKTMGTTWSVRLVGPADLKVNKLENLVKERLIDINQMASTYVKNSEINRLNNRGNQTKLDISRPMNQLLKLAFGVAQASSGAFDPTVAPLVNAYGFGAQGTETKDPAKAARRAADTVGYQSVRLEDEQIRFFDQRTKLDLSAIGKGYAVDEISALLTKQGLLNHVVEIGGEVFLKGRRLDGSGWQVAIESPWPGSPEDNSTFATIVLDGQAMATSGNYRNFKDNGGNRYHHIVDPRTGESGTQLQSSVTVISKSCAVADALATAIVVSGKEEAPELLKAFPGTEALVLTYHPTHRTQVWKSDGFPLPTSP